MNSLIAALDKYFVPIAGRIGAQRHLVAIRDAFIAIMPLILVGSMAVLINNFPNKSVQAFMLDTFGAEWTKVGGVIWNGTFAIMALLIVFGVAYNLAKSYNVDGMSSGVIAFGAFIVFAPQTGNDTWGLNFAWLGAQGLFVAIFIGIVSTEIYRFFVQRNITIKMPDGVPPGVAKSFASLIPAFVIFIIAGFATMTIAWSGTTIFDFIFKTIQQPLQGLGNTLPAALIFAFLIHLLWFFGLHGPNILEPIIQAVYLPGLEENIKLFSGGTPAMDVPNIITKPFFDTFVYLGGSGTTLALIVAIFLVGKSAQLRSVAKITAPPGCFNINEPVLFGLPMVLNPVMLIPFMLTPMVLVVTTYVAHTMHFVPPAVAMVPWATPPIFSGFLVTGGAWQGAALQLINFAIAVVIYYPFVVMLDRQALKTEKAAKKSA